MKQKKQRKKDKWEKIYDIYIYKGLSLGYIELNKCIKINYKLQIFLTFFCNVATRKLMDI